MSLFSSLSRRRGYFGIGSFSCAMMWPAGSIFVRAEDSPYARTAPGGLVFLQGTTPINAFGEHHHLTRPSTFPSTWLRWSG